MSTLMAVAEPSSFGGDRNPNTLKVTYGTADESFDEVFKGGKDTSHHDAAAGILKSKGVHDNGGDPVYRDVGYAIVFWLHLVVMGIVAYMNAITWDDVTTLSSEVSSSTTSSTKDWPHEEQPTFENNGDEPNYIHRVLVQMVVPCIGVAFLVTLIVTTMMVPSCPQVMVTSCVLGTLVYTLGMIMVMIVSTPPGVWWTYIVALGMLGIMIWYVKVVWKFIPYAAQNLKMACQAVKSNLGIYHVAIVGSVLSFLWTFFWIYVVTGVSYHEYYNTTTNNANTNTNHRQAQYVGVMDDDRDGYGINNTYTEDDDGDAMGGAIAGIKLFLLVLSFYWTSGVLMNTVQVTVAGVIGSWCFDYKNNNNSKCCCAFGCSETVFYSWYRAITYSFGSICMGSLLQALVSALRYMLEHARQQARNENNDNALFCSILYCILQCIVSLIEDIIEYFNQWAYIFVGIYGYGYLDAGRQVIELFKARGLTTIISNDLAGFVLSFTVFTVSIVTGLVAMMIDNMASSANYFFGDDLEEDATGASKYVAFFIGFLVGLVVSSVMTNVIRGAIRTIIVCFADAPSKLQENHPHDTQQMINTWVSVFPETQTVFAHPVVVSSNAASAPTEDYKYHPVVVT